MKRPLAGFGFAYLLCMFIAIQLAPFYLLLLTAACAAALFACVVTRKCLALQLKRGGTANSNAKRLFSRAAFVLCAALSALLVRHLYDAVILRPIEAFSGREATVLARVTAVSPGYGGDTFHASLRLLNVDGQPLPVPTTVLAKGISSANIGDILRVDLRFYTPASPRQRAAQLARGFRISVAVKQPPQLINNAPAPIDYLRIAQYAGGQNIASLLPQRLSSVVSAMSLADKRFLPPDVSEAYRRAGLSHLLVMSGLHLSLLCGLLFRALSRIFRHKRLASVAGMCGVVLLMAFAGFTPSILRSGMVWLFVFAAPLFKRQTDVYTSLGFAALLMCTQNPYAAGDVGLLLSFAATLGALASGQIAYRLPRPFRASLPLRVGRRLAIAFLTPLCVTLVSLPVLVWAGLGISLLSIPANVLAVPLLAPIVICGLVMALCAGLPVLGLFAQLAALVASVLLVFIEWLCRMVTAFPGAYFVLEGTFWFVTVLAVYALVLIGVRVRRIRAFSLAAVLLIPLALVLHLRLSAGTVRVTIAGGGSSPSLVVTQGSKAVVLYRGRLTLPSVLRVMTAQNITQCTLFIDMRQTWESTEYLSAITPSAVVVAGQDLLSGAVYAPFPDVDVYVKKQGGGTLACVDIAGYRIGLASGSVNLTPYGPLDVWVAGAGKVQGEYDVLLTGGEGSIWLRPAESVVFKEVWDDNEFG